ncbi:MAG: transferase [Hyphomonadaceae bacterium]
MTRFVVKTRADSPELRKAAMAIEQAAWGALGFLNFTKAHFAFYQQLLEQFADYQLCLVDEATGYPVAVGNCVPLACDFANLPPEGWDWIVETAANASPRRNAVGALAISVPHIHRNKGLARRMIDEFRNLAISKGHDGVIAPVRPSAKHLHPFIPMQEYLGWTDDKGRLFDPWLRSHTAAGGKIIKPAERSMTVEEPVAFWEMWRGSAFPTTGDYKIEGALTPVSIDLERDSGRYVEPNVWFAYQAA